MKYYFKKGFISFVYLFFMMIIAMAITAINDLMWLKILLSALNLGIYLLVSGAVAFKDGQDALKVRISNDTERLQIIKTGEDRPINETAEYKPFKGFIIGVFVSLPLIVLCVIHVILLLTGSTYEGLGAIASYLYYVVFIFFKIFNLSGGYYYLLSLTFLPVFSGFYCLLYNLGARKIELQQQIIENRRREIYGDKN